MAYVASSLKQASIDIPRCLRYAFDPEQGQKGGVGNIDEEIERYRKQLLRHLANYAQTPWARCCLLAVIMFRRSLPEVC